MIISKKKYEKAICEAEQKGRFEVCKERDLDSRFADVWNGIKETRRYIDDRLRVNETMIPTRKD